MNSVSDSNKKSKWLKKIAKTCMVCFLLVSMLSTMPVMSNANKAHSIDESCSRTFNPLCLCEENENQMQRYLPNDTLFHNHDLSECFVCALIHKMIEQQRLMLTESAATALVKVSLSAFYAISALTLSSRILSPVEQCIKSNN